MRRVVVAGAIVGVVMASGGSHGDPDAPGPEPGRPPTKPPPKKPPPQKPPTKEPKKEVNNLAVALGAPAAGAGLDTFPMSSITGASGGGLLRAPRVDASEGPASEFTPEGRMELDPRELYATAVSRVFSAEIIDGRGRVTRRVFAKYATDCSARNGDPLALVEHPLAYEYDLLTGPLLNSNIVSPGGAYLSPAATPWAGVELAAHLRNLEAHWRECVEARAQVRFLMTDEYGESLKVMIDKWHSLSLTAETVAARVLDVAIIATQKLKELHARGFVHGSLNLESLRIVANKHQGVADVVLVDFEHAKEIGKETSLGWDSRLSPLWMSVPELDGARPHPRHDLLRLLEILARILSGGTWSAELERRVFAVDEDKLTRAWLMDVASDFKRSFFWFRPNAIFRGEALPEVPSAIRSRVQGILEALVESIENWDSEGTYRLIQGQLVDSKNMLLSE